MPLIWKIAHIFLMDFAGHTLVLDSDGVAKKFANLKTLTVSSALDTVPPEIASFAFTPNSIDVANAPAGVTVNFSATDDLSGVVFFQVVFTSPSGGSSKSGTANFGAALTQAGSVVVTFPRFSEAGVWTVSSVLAADAAGNTLVLDRDAVSRLGFRTTLNVHSAADTVSPNLTAFDFKPAIVDTSDGPAIVRAEFTATDNFAGVRSVQVVFVAPSGVVSQTGTKVFSPAHEVTDSVDVNFPRSSEPGIWKIGSVMVTDDAGNTLILSAEQLPSRHSKTLLLR